MSTCEIVLVNATENFWWWVNIGWLGAIRCQAITWANIDLDLCRRLWNLLLCGPIYLSWICMPGKLSNSAHFPVTSVPILWCIRPILWHSNISNQTLLHSIHLTEWLISVKNIGHRCIVDRQIVLKIRIFRSEQNGNFTDDIFCMHFFRKKTFNSIFTKVCF